MKFFGFKNKKHVFLDYASITPLDKNVSKKMKQFEVATFSNPSALYSSALAAKDAVVESRKKIAEVLDTTKDQIYFTSGGTEANNLAILGIFNAFKINDFIPHFVTTTIEHPSILEVFKEVELKGGEVTYVNVNEKGIVSPKDVMSAIKTNTILVSVMYANNEIGTIQPISEIGRAIKEYRKNNKADENFTPYFHTDASQAVLYLNLNTHSLGVDLLTIDGIKMFGPRGAGILFKKEIVKIEPIIFGGGQEKGLRSGTENVPAIVGLSEALEIAKNKKENESARLMILRDYAIQEILNNFPNSHLNGSLEKRLPNNINICFPKIDAEFAVVALDVNGVSCSYSSSCRTLKEDSSSYVVESLGNKDCALSSLRFTLGRESTKGDIDFLVKALKKIVK
jgi:cysteine desulfurase